MSSDAQTEVHAATWRTFTKLMTYSSVAAAIILLLMAAFLV